VPWVEDPLEVSNDIEKKTPMGITAEEQEPFMKGLQEGSLEHGSINASKYDYDQQTAGVDVTGLALIKMPSFWLNLTIFGITSGLGLIFTNNIGNN